MIAKLFLSSGMLLLLGTFTSFNTQPPSVPTAKTIQQAMAKVNDSLYAGKYEISNLEYRNFLNELAIKDRSLAEEYKVDSTKWPDDLRYSEPMKTTNQKYHRHPAFSDYPVVNISYEAAIEYCKWLTVLYNSDSKRKFRKVVFTLPLKEEWTVAAQGGRSNSMFPWGHYYLVNRKGFYMCNFKPVGDSYIVRDSLGKPVIVNYNGETNIHSAEFPPGKIFYTMNVRSFSPNDLGIYNICGNAAEMTLTKGYAMGGSWNSYGGEINTKSIKQYTYPSTEVGFRIFMKIIEP